MRHLFQLLLIAWLIIPNCEAFGATNNNSFIAANPDFLLNGERFTIRSGEMHYSRVPRDYWRHRLRMARAMGLNTISTYCFWNVHEPQPGHFDFAGEADVAEFCRVAGQEGLKVIVRPGPYCCAEWDFGGLPWWLLQDPGVRVRTGGPQFLAFTRRYFSALAEQLTPLLLTRGGPIILVQVENEYDAAGGNKGYISALHDQLKAVGFDVPCFTSEVQWTLKPAEHKDLIRAIGSNNPKEHFPVLRRVVPDGPLFCSEYYTGWFNYWGRPNRLGTPVPRLVEDLNWMLRARASFNLYMVHGGTSFGFTAGANCPPFAPQPTSYGYGAPISEAGWDTAAFHAIREVLVKNGAPGEEFPAPPPRNPVFSFAPVEAQQSALLLGNLGATNRIMTPCPMEYLGQGSGCILYRTQLRPGAGEQLQIQELHDFGLVFLDGSRIATLDRRLKQETVALPARTNVMTLDILVDAFGRVNYGNFIRDRKGITERVQLIVGSSATDLAVWDVHQFPLSKEDLARLKFEPLSQRNSAQPAFYKLMVNVEAPADTFLDMRKWSKGVVWVNGRNLGRYWNIGPQQTLYCPGPWLRKGENEIVVFELLGTDNPVIAGLSEPILDQVKPMELGPVHRQKSQTLKLSGINPAHQGVLDRGTEWQLISLPATKGRYFCLEALASQSGEEFTSCAEIALRTEDGRDLSGDKLAIVYADSEEVLAENGSAANAVDGRPDTFWHTEWDASKPKHPHHLVIDLGREETITSFKYLARQDSANGRIRDFRVYVTSEKPPGL